VLFFELKALHGEPVLGTGAGGQVAAGETAPEPTGGPAPTPGEPAPAPPPPPAPPTTGTEGGGSDRPG